MKQRLFLFALMPFLTSSIFAQGGGLQQPHQWTGSLADRSFGETVANAGDVNGDGVDDILVSNSEHATMINTGTVFVYSGLTGALIREHSQGGSNNPTDAFGDSLACAGDVNGDGYGDYLIGAPSALVNGPGGNIIRGKVLLYSGFDGSLLYQIAEGGYSSDFGFSVSGLGDLDGDGFDDFIVGARQEDSPTVSNTGAAFVFSGITGAVLFTVYGSAWRGSFGASVAGAGDVTGDGVPDFLVGAPSANPNGRSEAGSAFVYSGSDGSLIQQVDGPKENDSLGIAVSGPGDLDGDGINDYIFSAPGPWLQIDGRPGFVVAYSGATGAKLYRIKGQFRDGRFGDGLAIDGGDINGDGYADFVVGQWAASTYDLASSGAAYVYSGKDGTQLYHFFSDTRYDYLGGSTSCGGDHNGDGFPDLILSKSGYDTATVANCGQVSVYSLANLDPYIHVDTRSLSSLQGGQVTFSLNFPVTSAGQSYQLLASLNTRHPVVFGGVRVPISPDAIFGRMLSNPPAVFQASMGVLDLNGDATCTATFPPGFLDEYISQSLWFAGVAFIPGVSLELSSVAVGVEVLP